MAYKKGLFKDGVPKIAGLLTLVITLIPLLIVNGVYPASTIDMTGYFGTLSEHIQFASYAGFAGMITIFPLLLRIKGILKSKQILLMALGIQMLLSILCATTDNMEIMILSSFVIGMCKMMGMIEIVLPMMFILSPKGDRGRFYSLFYPLSIGLGQGGGWLGVQLAYLYQWQYIYFIVAAMLLVAIIAVALTYHNERSSRRIPLYQIDWLSMCLMAVIQLVFAYIFVYGKYENWMESTAIQGALVSLPILLVWFIKRQINAKRPYVSLDIFKKRNVQLALLLMVVMQLLFSTSGVQSAFTSTVLKLNALDSISLNLMMLWGVLGGAVFSFIWLRYDGGVKMIIFLGFLALAAYHMIFYGLFGPFTDLDSLSVPVALKGASLLLLYIGLGLLVADKLAMMQMLNASMMLLLFRNIIGPVIATSLYTNLMYQQTAQNLSDLAQTIDIYNPAAGQQYNMTIRGAVSQGSTIDAASNLAAQAITGSVQMQAMLVTAKEIFGWVSIASLLVLVYVALVPMQKEKRKQWNRFKERFNRKQAEQLVIMAD